MTSRTRRNVKAAPVPETPKMASSDEEDSPKKEICEVNRRRSMRHSPGQSPTSPPRKTRRMKNSPECLENKQKNVSTSSRVNKSDKSPSHVGAKITKDLISDEEDCSPSKGNLDESSRNHASDSPTTVNRTNSVSPVQTPKKRSNVNTPSKNATPLTPSRRSTRSKGGGLNTLIDQENERSNVPSTSVELPKSGNDHLPKDIIKEFDVGCKRPLENSSDDEKVEKTNGELAVTTEERKRIKLDDISKPNGSLKILNCDGDVNHSTTNSSTSSNSKDLEGKDNCHTPIKRKLSSPTSDQSPVDMELNNSKRPKLIENKPCNSRLDISTKEGKSIKTADENTDCSLPDEKNSLEIDMLDKSHLLLKDFELSECQIDELCNLLPAKIKDADHIEIVEELVQRLLDNCSTITSMSSPRFNKLLRQLLMKYCEFDTTVEKKHKLCKNAHEWSKERKTVNLRHELELALMCLYFSTGFYRKAEEMASALYSETKKLQDKEKTVRACLCLSKAYHAMGNISKARANITTAKTEALKIYTPPNLQAELDLQSGIMQVAEEKDMETAFSYFKEAATGSNDKPMRARALKYMLLTKLLVNRPEEGEKSVHYPVHMYDIDEGVEALLSITKAAINCSLKDFKIAREKYGKLLSEDIVVCGVLEQLYSKMLEKNLLSIIKPYERMQISVVADKIHLPKDEVERRLSQMILDGGVCAQLDHRDDCLYVYEPEVKDNVYSNSVKSITQLDKTLSLLNRKVKKLL